MWPNPQETVDLVTFTEEILNGKLHLEMLCTFSQIDWLILQTGKKFTKLCRDSRAIA